MGALLPIVTKKDPSTQKVTKEYDKEDGDLTVLGEIISSLPIDVRLGKLVVYGYLFNLLEESVIIAAGLSNKSIFTFPFEQKIKAYANKLMWSNRSFSDCLAVLLAYRLLRFQRGFFSVENFIFSACGKTNVRLAILPIKESTRKSGAGNDS